MVPHISDISDISPVFFTESLMFAGSISVSPLVLRHLQWFKATIHLVLHLFLSFLHESGNGKSFWLREKLHKKIDENCGFIFGLEQKIVNWWTFSRLDCQTKGRWNGDTQTEPMKKYQKVDWNSGGRAFFDDLARFPRTAELNQSMSKKRCLLSKWGMWHVVFICFYSVSLPHSLLQWLDVQPPSTDGPKGLSRGNAFGDTPLKKCCWSPWNILNIIYRYI